MGNETDPANQPSPGEQALDDALSDSFPASDPPSQTDPDTGLKVADGQALPAPPIAP